MADSHRACSMRVHFGYEDHEWLSELAQDEAVSMHALVKRAVRHFRHWHEEGEKALEDALEIFEAERSGREDERRRRLYFQREYELQSRRLHHQLRNERNLRAKVEYQLRNERNLRAEREKQLHDERNLRAKVEYQLRNERNLRAEREKQLHDEHEHHERLARACSNLPFSPTVARLLTLAVRSDSDAEAMTAVGKARALHRKEQDSASVTP